MDKEFQFYNEIFVKISEKEKVENSQMFGKPCLKIKGKAFVCFFQNEMVFKLQGEAHEKASQLKGSKLFDPSGKGRSMKEWVQIPFKHSKQWEEFAMFALMYVKKGK